jgi:hypothetical protein
MQRRPWSYPLELGAIVLTAGFALDWWREGLPAALGSFPVKAATVAILCLVLTAINLVREARKQRPS